MGAGGSPKHQGPDEVAKSRVALRPVLYRTEVSFRGIQFQVTSPRVPSAH